MAHSAAAHGRNALPDSARPADTAPLRIGSRELLQDRSELIIIHEGREYRLRVTQNGKLILTA